MSKYIYLEVIKMPEKEVISRRDMSNAIEPFITYELSIANMACDKNETVALCYSPKELPIIEKS